MRNLRVLSIEFSHIADSTGMALISLLPILKRPHFRLQLMCRESQIPGYTDAALGAGGFHIPDTAWRRVAIASPDLYVLFVFYRIRDYDDVRRFLSPSIPMHEIHLQFGIDLKMKQRQDSDVSCFVRHIAYQYANALTTVSIHQWRFAVFPIRRVFELMPFLTRFFYVGRVEDDVDLRRALRIIACGVCYKLKHLKIQIQDEERSREFWGNVVDSLMAEYHDIMNLLGINFCLSIYKN
ncbi:hypothetical protein O0L34_g2625 [Tuta absoluta]|nr:hypothetical protein O0L34_g2625 [Tuta absoluta]